MENLKMETENLKLETENLKMETENLKIQMGSLRNEMGDAISDLKTEVKKEKKRQNRIMPKNMAISLFDVTLAVSTLFIELVINGDGVENLHWLKYSFVSVNVMLAGGAIFTRTYRIVFGWPLRKLEWAAVLCTVLAVKLTAFEYILVVRQKEVHWFRYSCLIVAPVILICSSIEYAMHAKERRERAMQPAITGSGAVNAINGNVDGD